MALGGTDEPCNVPHCGNIPLHSSQTGSRMIPRMNLVITDDEALNGVKAIRERHASTAVLRRLHDMAHNFIRSHKFSIISKANPFATRLPYLRHTSKEVSVGSILL